MRPALSDEQALEAKRLRESGVKLNDIAALFGVSTKCINRTFERIGWSDRPPRSFARLRPKQKRFVELMAEGLSARQAALKAGYAPNTAEDARRSVLAQPGVEQALKDVVRQRVPNDLLAERLREGVDAKDTKFFAHEGRIVSEREVVDFGQRRQYIELAAKLTGQFKEQLDVGGQLQLVVDI